MTWAVRLLLVALLAVATFQVHRIRARLAGADEDPGAVAALKARLDALPESVGNGAYEGQPLEFSERIVRLSGADTYASRVYRDREGNSFRLYVGGSISNEENFHAPSYCMPAAGWEVLESGAVPFEAYEAEGGDRRMQRMLLQYGPDRMVVYYWFQAGRRQADHEWAVRYYRFLDLLADEPLRPTLIVTLYVPVTRDVPASERAAAEFLRAIGPSLRSSLTPGAN